MHVLNSHGAYNKKPLSSDYSNNISGFLPDLHLRPIKLSSHAYCMHFTRQILINITIFTKSSEIYFFGFCIS